MKSLFLFFFFSSLLFSQDNQKLIWFDSYKDALVLAKKTDKDILLILSGTGCRRSGKLKHFTIESEKITKFINKNFILLEVMNTQLNRPKEFQTSFYPTSFIVNKNGKILKRIKGYHLVNDYLKQLQR